MTSQRAFTATCMDSDEELDSRGSTSLFSFTNTVDDQPIHTIPTKTDGSVIKEYGGISNPSRFIDSDVKSINLDNLMRMWLSQLIDNSLDGDPTYIEVRLYMKGVGGFDVLDNGRGYTQSELA